MVSPLFVAADVGNTRIKLGLFEESVPELLRTLSLPEGGIFQFERITPWLADIAQESFCWRIASVNQPAVTLLIGECSRQHATKLVVGHVYELVFCEAAETQVSPSRPDRQRSSPETS